MRNHVYLHSFLPVTLDAGVWIVIHSGRFIPGERDPGIHSIEDLGESQGQAGCCGVRCLVPAWSLTPDHPPRGRLIIRTGLSRGTTINEPCIIFPIIIFTHTSNRNYSFAVCYRDKITNLTFPAQMVRQSPIMN